MPDADSTSAPDASATPNASLPDAALDAGLTLSAAALDERLEAFLTEHLARRSKETVGTYRRALRELTRWAAAQQGAFRFRAADVERYKRYLMDERGLHDVSVSTYLTAVRRFCQYLVDIGLLADNPAKAVKGNSRPASHSRSILTMQEVEALLHALPFATVLELRDRALVYMMLGAGLAEIELVRADRADFVLSASGHVLHVQGKGHTVKDQQAPIDDRVAAAVLAYLAARGESPPEAPLFASHGHRSAGERLNTRSVRTRIRRAMEAAGLHRPGLTPHSLTHTAALLWLNAGMTVDEVRARMRHGTLDTTMISLRQRGLLKKSPEEVTRILREA